MIFIITYKQVSLSIKLTWPNNFYPGHSPHPVEDIQRGVIVKIQPPLSFALSYFIDKVLLLLFCLHYIIIPFLFKVLTSYLCDIKPNPNPINHNSIGLTSYFFSMHLYRQSIFLLPCLSLTTTTCPTPTLPSPLALTYHSLKINNFITKTSHIQVTTTRDNIYQGKKKTSHKKNSYMGCSNPWNGSSLHQAPTLLEILISYLPTTFILFILPLLTTLITIENPPIAWD